jgi:enamine deaminase RidA (YjgF/YER057c/UK114 family)
MAKREIETNLLMRPIAHFSHAARVGDLIHIGATAGTDAERRLAGASPGRVDFAAQTRQMLDNLETVLGLLEARLDDVVRVKGYVVDARDIPAYRAIFGERLGSIAPNHIIVGSHGFPLPQAALEIDVIAMAGAKARRVPGAGAEGHPSVLVDDTFYATALPDRRPGATDAASQARTALTGLTASLAAGGLTMADVVNVHMTLSDARHYAAIEEVYAEAFAAPYPARCIVAAPLEEPQFCVQIEATAVRGGGKPIGAADAALGSASPAMLAGDVLYSSAHAAPKAEDCEAQTRGAWDKINALVAAAGFTSDSIVRTNNVLTDWRNYAGFNAGYGANVTKPYPPRATVLGCLRDPAALVQVEAIAHRNGGEAVIVQVPGVP